MTSAEFTAWIVRSLALALATLLAHRACPVGRSSRAVLPLLGFAGLLALTGHEYWHGPRLPLASTLALPPALTEWPAGGATPAPSSPSPYSPPRAFSAPARGTTRPSRRMK